MELKVAQGERGAIDYRLNILGIRVFEHSCQLIARNGRQWAPLGPPRTLPVYVPQNSGELIEAATDALLLTAYQYAQEHPASDLASVLGKGKNFVTAPAGLAVADAIIE